MRRSSFIPDKTDAPLVIDPDRMLSIAIGFQGLKPIAGRNSQIIQDSRLIQKAQFAQGDRLDV
jgi:hypothetical protein